MASYVSPLLWLGFGLIGMWSWNRMVTRATLENRTAEQLESLRPLFNSRLHLLLTGVFGVLSLYWTVRAVWIGAPQWWLWLLATAAIIGSMVARERAATRFFQFLGEDRGHRDDQERRRQRYLLTFTAVSVTAFLVARLVAPDDARNVDTIRAMIGGVSLVIAVLAALGAGWAAVWVFKDTTQNR